MNHASLSLGPKPSALIALACLLASLLFVWGPSASGANPVEQAPEATIRVLAYESLLGKKGWGEALRALFEGQEVQSGKGCKVQWVPAADAGRILTRMELESERGDLSFDVVMGLDTALFTRAAKWFSPGVVASEDRAAWAPHIAELLDAAGPEVARAAVPFDYGMLTFLGREGKGAAPSKWDGFTQLPAKSLILLDPRTSLPGWALLMGLRSVYPSAWGEKWKRLREASVTLASSWSAGYALFMQKRAPWIWTYTTSLAYHRAHGETGYRLARLEEGHPLQLELAGVVKRIRTDQQQACVQKFVEALSSEAAQALIAEKQWMFPVRKGVKLPASFNGIPSLENAKPLMPPSLTADGVADILKQWERLSRGP